MDFNAGVDNTISMIKQFRKNDRHTKIIMLADENDKETVMSCLQAGVDGYLLRNSSLTHLKEAIIEAYNGGLPMSAQIGRKM